MSTVTLRRIEWDRCFSFGDSNYIDLDAEQLTQIIAPNGHGKSSIPLIVEEALYNKNSKGAKKSDIPNRLLDGSYNITLHFSVGADDYKIVTERKSGIKIKLFKNGDDISSHTATNTFKQIEELIGIDFKIFQQLVYQSTTSSLAFLTATDTARKKFLLELFSLEEYTRLFETFKAVAKELSSETSALEGKVSTIEKWLKSNSSLDLEKLEIQEVPVRPDFSDQIGEISSKITNVKKINEAIQRNEQAKKKLESFDIETLRSQDGEEVSYDDIQHEIGTLQASKTSADAIVKKLQGLEDQCPTCLQTIDKEFYDNLLNTNKTDSSSYSKKIEELNSRINEIKAGNALIRKARESIREYEKLESNIDYSLESNLLDASELEADLKNIKNKLAVIEANISKITAANNEAIKHNSKIDIYLEQNEAFTSQLKEASEQIEELTNKLKNLEVLKKAFSTNGLIAYKLENLVKDLEVFANEYLAELSDGRFSLQFSISNDKLDVVVTDDGKEISILSPSSGEMARINISTLLAIRKLMSSISKNTVNALFLDEVISVLDDAGKEKLVEVLLEEEGLNTFLVSHNWSHPLVAKIEIRKKDGISWVDRG